MHIIADIGATNSRWLVQAGLDMMRIDREGYNAFTHDRAIWKNILGSLNLDKSKPMDFYLYGAGFYDNKFDQITEDVKNEYPQAAKIFLAKDLLGACHGMAKNNEGIVVIMGTGSNTCLYDGEKIVRNIETMGFILGSEGSAGSIGKAVIRAVIREKMPAELIALFRQKYDFADIDIILRVHQPGGNQFLGQFAKFAGENIDHPFMHDLIHATLRDIFNLLADYNASDKTHYFTGSIANHFKSIMADLCAEFGIKDYHIIPDYTDGIAEYHGFKASA